MVHSGDPLTVGIPAQEGHADGMGELTRLIQQWLDAEPGRNKSNLAIAAGLGRNTVSSLFRRDPKEPPRRKTLEGISKVTRIPFAQLRDAAYADAGQRVSLEPADDPHVTFLVDALDEASGAARKAAVAAALAAIRAIDD